MDDPNLSLEPQIKFSKNWNGKLNCTFFTTIRKYNKDKLEHYKKHLGYQFYVKENGKKPFRAQLMNVRHINEATSIADEIIMTDTGHTAKEGRQVLKSFGCGPADKVILLTFRRLEDAPRDNPA